MLSPDFSAQAYTLGTEAVTVGFNDFIGQSITGKDCRYEFEYTVVDGAGESIDWVSIDTSNEYEHAYSI